MEEFIEAKNKRFQIVSLRAEHEDHSTYVCTWSGRTYILRVYREGYAQTMEDYKVLKRAGINMAKICFHDDAKQIVIFDYFPEDDCLTALSKGPLSELYFAALFALYRFARFSKVALDWAPQNFMLRGTQMFYLPTKWEKLTDNNTLEKVGIREWFLGKEGHALLKRKGFDTKGLPLLEDAVVNKSMVLTAVQYW